MMSRTTHYYFLYIRDVSAANESIRDTTSTRVAPTLKIVGDGSSNSRAFTNKKGQSLLLYRYKAKSGMCVFLWRKSRLPLVPYYSNGSILRK